MSQVNGAMIPAGDIASIASGATVVDGVGFTSKQLRVHDIWLMGLLLYATGGAGGANGDVEFNILGSPDGVNWGTEPYLTLTVTLSGTSKVAAQHQIDVTGLHSIKIGSIKNADAAQAATLVGAIWGKTYAN